MAPPYNAKVSVRSFVRIYGPNQPSSNSSDNSPWVLVDLSKVANVPPVNEIPPQLTRESDLQSARSLERNPNQLFGPRVSGSLTNYRHISGIQQPQSSSNSNNRLLVVPARQNFNSSVSSIRPVSNRSPFSATSCSNESATNSGQVKINRRIILKPKISNIELLKSKLKEENEKIINENEKLRHKLILFKSLFRNKNRSMIYKIADKIHGTENITPDNCFTSQA